MSFLLHDPIWRPLDDNGAVMPGCYFEFYESETTTPAAVYADADLATELDDELVSDASGRFPAIYGDTAIVYRRKLFNADDELISDTDPIHPHVQFPAGTMVMFNGTSVARDAAYPPALWEVSDGDNGTPDTRDRFPIGVSGTKAIGTTGGVAPGGTAETTENGAHDHGAVTGSHTLTTSDIPSHKHLMFIDSTSTGTVTNTNQVYVASNSGGDQEYSLDGGSGAATVGLTSASGSGGGHTHSVTSGGAHTHNVTMPAQPYFTIWFLQRKP